MAKIFVTPQFIRLHPQLRGVSDPRQIHFHFRPIRPAYIMVSLDPVSGEVNLSGGTYGPVCDDPLTVALHIHERSFDATRNVITRGVGTEVVLGLPSRHIITQTWMTALPLPRGISVADVGLFTLFPSRWVKPPSLVARPVNLDCVVTFITRCGTLHIVFCKVIGASIETDLLGRPRQELIRLYPTFECDDIENRWGGAIERLSVMGPILPSPVFPCGPKAGLKGDVRTWITDLVTDGLLLPQDAELLRQWLAQWEAIAHHPEAAEWRTLRSRLSRAIELMAWEEFPALHEFLLTAAQGESA